MTAPPISREPDGMYHPASEEDICALVRWAAEHKLQVRCRGSAHSVAWAVYADPGPDGSPGPNKVSTQHPPEGPNVNIMLDRYTALRWIDQARGLVEVDAGIHLAADPEDPRGAATLENSLLYQAFRAGWTVSALGGITHQTVGGFLSTGSAGGSLTYHLGENLVGFRVVDGHGVAQWIERDTDPDRFHAFGVSLGLLGIISKVRFQLVPTYHVNGQEFATSTDADACPIDLFGNGTADQPSLRRFFTDTPYTRILWWPQRNVNRAVIWQAVRGKALPAHRPQRYYEFGGSAVWSQVQQLAGAALFTMLGNRGVTRPLRKLQRAFTQFSKNLKHRGVHPIVRAAVRATVRVPITLAVVFFGLFRPLLIWLYPVIIRVFQPISKPGHAEQFSDHAWRSLPMDNTVDDVLMGTEFTEIFVPIADTTKAMQLFKQHFEEGGLAATGYHTTELYAGHKSEFWMSPSYGQDMLRIDAFVHINESDDPAGPRGLFRQYWELCRDNGIPIRLHWGKFLPEYDYAEWARYFREQYPRWDDFLALRQEQDPHGIFLSRYWRRHLLGEEDTST